MAVNIELTQEAPVGISETFLRAVAEQTLHEVLPQSFLGREIAMNIIAVAPEKIQALNRTYLGKDRVTDILSFGEYINREALIGATEDPLFLGELFLCAEYIRQAAHEDGVTMEREMAYIVSHGVLHLFGFDHSDEMFALQDRVTDALAPSVKD